MSAHTLYFQKLDFLGLHFARDSMGLSSFKFLQWASIDIISATESVSAIQDRPRSIILVPIEKAHVTSY